MPCNRPDASHGARSCCWGDCCSVLTLLLAQEDSSKITENGHSNTGDAKNAKDSEAMRAWGATGPEGDLASKI